MQTGPGDVADETAAGMMPCPVCREPIQPRARKCIKCQSDLGWRRYLGFSNTTLALLTALVSVCATSYPALHRALTPERAALAVHYLGLNPGSLALSILVTNPGRSVGALRADDCLCALAGAAGPADFSALGNWRVHFRGR